MVRDTQILYRKIAHLERELALARSAGVRLQLDQEIKAHEATRGVLQDLVLDRGGSNSTKVYLERRDEVMKVLRTAPCYCLSSAHYRNCPVGKLLWELSTQTERQEIIDRDHEWALREMLADRRDNSERLIFGAWPVSPQPDTLIVNGRDYEQIVQDALRYTGGLSDWLPTTRTIAGVPGNPAADGSQAETEPEGE